MAQTQPVRAASGVLAAIVPLMLWGIIAATPVFSQEEQQTEVQIEAEAPANDARETQPHPPVAGQDAELDLQVEGETEAKDNELKVDFDAEGFREMLGVIRQMRLEILQLRRELAEARGDRPLLERRLGYRQDQGVRDGERAENRIDNRQERRGQRIENRGERRDLRDDRGIRDRERRDGERRDGERVETRVERRDDRQDRRDDRQEDREERQEVREERREAPDAKPAVPNADVEVEQR